MDDDNRDDDRTPLGLLLYPQRTIRCWGDVGGEQIRSVLHADALLILSLHDVAIDAEGLAVIGGTRVRADYLSSWTSVTGTGSPDSRRRISVCLHAGFDRDLIERLLPRGSLREATAFDDLVLRLSASEGLAFIQHEPYFYCTADLARRLGIRPGMRPREHAVVVDIIRFADAHQPGFVECRLVDADAVTHVFHEKVPIVSLEDLDAGSSYPRPGMIGCELIDDDGASARVRITTQRPDGVESVAGVDEFVVRRDQLL